MLTRRQGLALAGVLTATALTGGIAVAGLAHGSHHQAAGTPAVRIVQPSNTAPAPPPAAEEEVD